MVRTLAISFALALSVITGFAQSPAAPSVDISNGVLSATLYLPDAARGFYRGTRFDWSGVIGRLIYSGHNFHGPWFTRFDAGVRDFNYEGSDIVAGPQSAIVGPVEEFSTDGQGLGFADAPAGGTFVKIGVGVLRKPADGAAYSMFRSYDVVDAGTWNVATTPESVTFSHDLGADASGYGYHYEKTVRLVPGKAEMIIDHRLTNRGTRPIVSTVYNHNFLVLDGLPPGPDFTIDAPFAWQTPRPLDPAMATIDGTRFRYTKTLVDRERVSTPFQGFGPTAADYDFRIEHRAAGVGMRITADRPLSSLALWSIRSVLSLEPFIAMTIAPGQEFTWRYTYQYYSLPARQ